MVAVTSRASKMRRRVMHASSGTVHYMWGAPTLALCGTPTVGGSPTSEDVTCKRCAYRITRPWVHAGEHNGE